MSRPPARVPHLCELRICEPLVATLVLLIILLSKPITLPAPFCPVPPPPTTITDGSAAPPQIPTVETPVAAATVAAATAIPEAVIGATPTIPPTPTTLAAIASPTIPSPPPEATATQSAPTNTPQLESTPTLAPQDEPTSTREPSPTSTGPPSPTQQPSPSPQPTDTPKSREWNLAQDIIGLWEQIEQDWQYYFDFLEDEIVIVSNNGARPYRVEGNQTIVIEMPGEPSVLVVRDLAEDTLILEGVFGPSDEFHREMGVPNLRQELIGLWTRPATEHHPLEFTPGGIALGEFGRGTYRIVSDSHIFVDCDDQVACSPYLAYGQSDDAPLPLRVYEIADDRLTVQGLRYPERWTLERFGGGHPTLAADIVGQWEDENGSTLQFTAAGVLYRDGNVAGSYEVLSETTLWITLDDNEETWIVTELDADTMAYALFDFFWDEPRAYTRVE